MEPNDLTGPSSQNPAARCKSNRYTFTHRRGRLAATMMITAMASTATGLGLSSCGTQNTRQGQFASVSATSPQNAQFDTFATNAYLTVNGSRGISSKTIESLRDFANQAGFASTIVHQGTIDLRSIQRLAAIVRSTPDGTGIPMSVLAVDPLTIGPTSSAVVADTTKSGAVVVGMLAATTSGIKEGDELTLLDRNGSPKTVLVGAIEADQIIGGAEIMMSLETAANLGLDRPFAIRLWGIREPESLDAAMTAIVSMQMDQTIRVRSSQRIPTIDDTIPQGELKALLGDFWIKRGHIGALQVDPSWKAAHVGMVDLPIVGNLTCNTKVAKAVAGALQDLRNAGLESLIHTMDSRRFGGCFSARVTRSLTGNSGRNLSRHTWGAAIDLNPSDNPYGGPSMMDPRVIDAFHQRGFVWGGTFLVPDPMHFEYTGR